MKYQVSVQVSYDEVVEVEADSQALAESIAEEYVRRGVNYFGTVDVNAIMTEVIGDE